MLAPNPHNRLTIEEVLDHPWMKDRDKIPKTHLADTVEELKRFNARRKLKGAVQSVAGGVMLDPLCTDTDSGKLCDFLVNNNRWLNLMIFVLILYSCHWCSFRIAQRVGRRRGGRRGRSASPRRNGRHSRTPRSVHRTRDPNGHAAGRQIARTSTRNI